MTLSPVVPNYAGRCVSNVLPVLHGNDTRAKGGLADLAERVSGAAGIVLVLLDGLGDEQLDQRAEIAPLLHAGRLDPIVTVAPSTTAAALTSIMTGVAPGVHGILGYRFVQPRGILQALRWSMDGKDAAGDCPPERVQRSTPLLRRHGGPVPYVGKKAFAHSGFTKAHLRGCDYRAVEDSLDMAGVISDAVRQRDLVVAYHDAIDKIAHHEGLGETYDAAIGGADRLVGEIRSSVPDDVVVVVTSDHGQVDVGPASVELSPSTMALVDFMSGEGRFRWLHARPEDRSDLLVRARDELGGSCWVRSRREVIAEGWFGDVDDEVVDRLGDVAVVPFIDAYVPDPAEPLEARMHSRHGSLTSAEMVVPLVVL
jgi:hypothetical protein